jgi:copper(I)-binding protein
MLRSLLATIALLLPLLSAAEPQSQAVEVTHAWARVTPPGIAMGAVYLTLQSHQDDQLMSASTPLAESVEMHESTMSNNVMTMHQLTTVPLPRSRPVRFEPSGKHFMLIGLRKPLSAGETFPFTLMFSKAGALTVHVNVVKED